MMRCRAEGSLAERSDTANWAGLPNHVQERVNDAERFIGWVLVMQLVFGIGLFVVIAIFYVAVQQPSGLILILAIIGGNAVIFYLILLLVYGPIVRREFERAVTPCLIFTILAIVGLSILATGLLFLAYWNLRRAREWIAPPRGAGLRAP